MKKIFLFSLSLLILLLPTSISAITLVTCDPCTFSDLLGIIPAIIDLLIKYIVVPLATFFLIVGGIALMASAGNPNLASTGKKIMFTAIIGLFLALCAWLIINTIVKALGGTM